MTFIVARCPEVHKLDQVEFSDSKKRLGELRVLPPFFLRSAKRLRRQLYEL